MATVAVVPIAGAGHSALPVLTDVTAVVVGRSVNNGGSGNARAEQQREPCGRDSDDGADAQLALGRTGRRCVTRRRLLGRRCFRTVGSGRVVYGLLLSHGFLLALMC